MTSDRDLFTRFITYLLTEKRVANNTFSAYQRDLKQFFSYLEAQKISLSHVTTQVLKSFLHHLKQEQMSARSMARKIAALKLFFKYLHERCNWSVNLAHDLITPKLAQTLPKYVAETDIEQLLTVCEADTSLLGKRNCLMLYLLYSTGMRISELCSLTVSSLHLDTGFIRVVGKGGKDRILPLPNAVLTLVKQYVEETHPLLSAHELGKKTEYLFPIVYGKTVRPITRQALWFIVKNLWIKTGNQKPLSPHILRHSLATHLLKKGVDLRSLQMLLGHEHLTTVEVYTHVETEHLRSIYNKKHPRS